MTTPTPITRVEHKARLLEKYPTTIGTNECAEIVGAHPKTIQILNRSGKLPFKNTSLTRHSIQFLAVDVIEWVFARSAGEGSTESKTETKKPGRKLGSKNKPKAAQATGEGA